MIHDLDIVVSLLGESPQTVSGAGVQQNRHATATLTFASDTVANLTASRLTQKKVRTLDVVAEECLVRVDYMSKDVEIHRQSRPEYITDDTDIRYRHESLVERPVVDSTEPLVNELSAFLTAVKDRTTPVVDGEDGLRALQLAMEIDRFRIDGDDGAVTADRLAATDLDSEVQLD
jgi:predicted dehydrogenase